MKENVIILSTKQYSIEQQDGSVNKGTSVWYITADNMQPRKTGDMNGYQPAKAALDYDFHDFVKDMGGAPIKAVGEFEMRQSGNQTVLKMVNAIFDEGSLWVEPKEPPAEPKK